MAILLTLKDKASSVLKIYEMFSVQPREELHLSLILSKIHAVGLRPTDVNTALRIAQRRGWLERLDDGAYRLTPAGFAAI
jgi:predicted transcriptional regulator of viral defense system